MTCIEAVTLEAPDPTAANAFYTAAFGLGASLALRSSDAPTTGFRGCTLSLVVSQPSTVDEFIGAAVDAGATPLKPTKKGFWGYGGVVRAPDGMIWKVAKDAGISPDGTGSHRIVICSDAGAFTDPDGFAWEAAAVRNGRGTASASGAVAIPQAN